MKIVDPSEFNQYIMNTAKDVIQDYQLIEPDDKIAVGLSGGKDSVLTLHILVKLMDEFDFEVVAVSIDEGISGYRDQGIEAAKVNAAKLGVELVEGSFKRVLWFNTRPNSRNVPKCMYTMWSIQKTAFK